MSVLTTYFNPQVVYSKEDVTQYFEAEGAKALIKVRNANYESKGPQQVFQNRWHVALVQAKALLDPLLTLFFQAMGELFEAFSAAKLAIYCKVIASHQGYDTWRLKTFAEHGNQYLVSAVNAHRLDTSDFFLQKTIPLSEIADKRIEEATSPRKELKFSRLSGVCRGMSEWFIYLYFKTQHLYSDKQTRLVAIAKEFEQGASRPAALLHTFVSGLGKFLPVSEASWGSSCDSVLLWKKSEAEVLSAIKGLSSGIYKCGVDYHALVYIKINDSLGYIWDPNAGLIRFDDEVEKKVFKFLAKYQSWGYNFSRVFSQYSLAHSASA